MSGALLLGVLGILPWSAAWPATVVDWGVLVAGVALGLLLAIKRVVRRYHRYQRPVWPPAGRPRGATGLALSTLAILSWTLVSALNARSVGDFEPARWPEASGYVAWLPHSLYGPATWWAFFLYLGLAGILAAAFDWLPGMTGREKRVLAEICASVSAPRSGARYSETTLASARAAWGPWYVPGRVRCVIWVLCGSTALMVLVALLPGLLEAGHLIESGSGRGAVAPRGSCGSFPWTSSGLALVNLVWPMGLGFWWFLHRRQRRAPHPAGRSFASPRLLLPLVTLLMLVALGAAANRVGWFGGRRTESDTSGLARPTSATRDTTPDGDRLLRFWAQGSAKWLGTGPGTIEAWRRLQRPPRDSLDEPPIPSDWLATRVAFGWMGFAIIGLALLTALGAPLAAGGLLAQPLRACLLVSTLACLFHAWHESPLQHPAVLLVFLFLICLSNRLGTASLGAAEGAADRVAAGNPAQKLSGAPALTAG